MGSVTFLRLKRPTGGAFEATFSVVLELVLLRGKKAFQATPTQLLRVPFKIFDEYHPYFLYGSIPLLLKYFCLTTAKLKMYLHNHCLQTTKAKAKLGCAIIVEKNGLSPLLTIKAIMILFSS